MKCMHIGGGMQTSCIIFDHVIHLKDWTNSPYYVYNIIYCEFFPIMFCDKQCEWRKL